MSQATADSAQNQIASEEASALAPDNAPENTTTTDIESLGGSGEVETTNTVESTPTMEERVANVDSPADFEAMMAEVQQNPSAFDTPPVEEEQPTPVETEEATAPPEGTGEVEEQQDESAVEDEVQNSEAVPELQANEGGDKPPQFRLRPTEKVDAEALKIMKAAEVAQSPVSLTQALAIAKRTLGIEDSPTPSQEKPELGQEEGESDDPSADITLSEVKQELKDLRKQHSQALRDGDLDEAADVMDQIGDTEDLMEVVSERESTQEQTSRKQHDENFESSVAEAEKLYSDFGDSDSEFYQRCAEIDQALKDTEDPRFYEAEKPLLIARMAARELNIAPNSASRKPAVVQKAPVIDQVAQPRSTSPQPPRTEKPGQLPAASGASRTAGAPAAATLETKVNNISSPEDFERLAMEVFSANR